MSGGHDVFSKNKNRNEDKGVAEMDMLIPDGSTRARSYSTGEEIVNSITHGIGALLSVTGLVFLVVLASQHGDVRHIVGFSVFGTALVLLYTASTLYHSLTHPTAKKVFKILDHSAIFLLIAGSYTPFMLVSLGGTLGWTILGIVWALAVLGIVMKSVFIGRFKRISLVVYLGMGWLCVFALRPMLEQVPGVILILILLGGLCYTVGVVFYVWRKLPFNHAVWHLFVLAGSACHYFAVLHTLST